MFFAWFMASLMNPLLLITGILLGATWALTGAASLYRYGRRRRLRRDYRSDRPRCIQATLEPRWAEFDPDEEHVDSRCVCHNRRIPEGETVLLWPETGSLGLIHIAVYCMKVKEPV